MKNLVLVTLSLAVILPIIACTSSKDKNPRTALDVHPRFEELSSEVPKGFFEADKWNHSAICPEGSTLTPLTRYNFEPGENSHGFKFFFGRSCAIIQENDPETEGRKLASADPGATQASVSVLPHGPFIWWYENGKKMETGNFDHGTLAVGTLQFEPDGSTTVKQ